MDASESKNNMIGFTSKKKTTTSETKIEKKKSFDFTEDKFLHSKRNFDFDSALNNANNNNEDDFESIFSNSNKNTKQIKPQTIIKNIDNKNFVNINSITNNYNNFNNNKGSKSKNNLEKLVNQSANCFPNLIDEHKDLISFNIASEQNNNAKIVNVIPTYNMKNIKGTENINKIQRKDSNNFNINNQNIRKSSTNNVVPKTDIDNGNNNNQSLFNFNFFSKNQNANEINVCKNNTTNNNETFVTANSKPIQNNDNTNINNNEKNMDQNVINVLNEIFDSNKSDLSNLNNINLFSNNNQEMINMFSNPNAAPLQNGMNNYNQNQQKFVNMQNMNFNNNNNNININIPQQVNSPIPIKNTAGMNMKNMNFNNNCNFFNYYPNQVLNPQGIFYPPNQGNIQIPNSMGPYIPNHVVIPYNMNNQTISNNLTVENTAYDTDKVQKTLHEMNKIYNNTSNNFNNNFPNQNLINNSAIANNINLNYNQNMNRSNSPNIIMANKNPQITQQHNNMNIKNKNIIESSNQQMNNNGSSRRSNSNAQNNNQGNQSSNMNLNANQNYNLNNIQLNPPSKDANFINSRNQQINKNNNIKVIDPNFPYQNNIHNQKQVKNNQNLNLNNDENMKKPNLNNENKNLENDNRLENSYEDDKGNSQFKPDVSNINIINIETHINNINLNKEEDNIEKIANQFLFEQLSKGSLHWLISSKDIQREKQIGFGGSSEVYKGNYRGTEVAIKKLRIIEVNDENLKEFKREVSSLIMLRHPNLVLFMGAM